MPRKRLAHNSNIVLAILHLAGGSRFADAARELRDGSPAASGDFTELPAELAVKVLNQAGHEFRHAADGDLGSAELALEELLAAAPKRETLGRALRDAESLRTYLLNHGGRERRAGLLSDDAQRYFDRLLDLTCEFISRTVHETDLAGRAERAGIAELLANVDLWRQETAELLRTDGKAWSGDALAVLRVAGAQARRSTQPEILPGMDRLGALETAVGGLTKSLAIIGEGGLGKSVLAGQLFERFQADTSTIFVPCTRIPASAELTDSAAVDLAFGQATAGDRDAGPLTAILANLPAGSRAVVIVDTLDLILTEQNADDVAYVLRQIARTALLFMTCRDQEWHSYLESERDLVEALYRVPALSSDEIGEWAEAYVQASGLPQDRRETFAASLSHRLSAAGVRDVFSSPLRLAMACDIYAAAGVVPAGLTITRLYEAYWEGRVARDRRGRRAYRAAHQVQAAEALAASVWEASGSRFIEYVPADDAMTATGLNDLLSEGTVQVLGGRYAFFHQTYAEYAVARHLAIRATSAELDRLEAGLRAGVPGYWAVAKHLLMLEIPSDRLQELAAHVPRDSVEGIRLHFQSAMAHDDSRLVERLAAELKERRPALLIASVGVLESAAGDCVGPALDIALWCLGNADTSSFPTVAMTVGPLIPAARSADQAAALGRALDICLKRMAADRRRHIGPVIRRLLEDAVTADATGIDLRMLVDRYGQLPEPARAWVLSAARHRAAGPQLTTALIVRALGLKCPTGATEDAAGLLISVWQEPEVRAAAGWSDWRSMLSAALPERWNACQLRLMRHLCADRATALELLAAVFDPDTSIERTQYTNAVLNLAADEPDLVAQAVIRTPRTTSNGVLGTLATVASHLAGRVDAHAQSELADSMEAYLGDHPHVIWPVVLKLACDNPSRLREYVERLTRFSVEDADGLMHGRSTVRRAFAVIVSAAEPAVVRELETELRALCTSGDPADLEQIARLQGRLTPVSATARQWVSEQLLEGTRPKVARAAAQATADSLNEWDREELKGPGLEWLLGLVASEQPHSVRAVVAAVDQQTTSLQLPETWGPVVVDRLVRSLASGEDQEVQTALIRLISSIDHATGISTADAVLIIEAHLEAARVALERSSAADSRARSAAYARLLAAVTTLGATHLGLQELGDLAVRVLTTIDSAAVVWRERPGHDKSGRPRKNLADMLIRVVTTQPLAMPRLEDAWPHCSASNKAAIAECVALVEAGTRGVISLRLARRADCPPDISNLLHARFGG
ncbi:hypothetical protein GCM10009554_59340 [Kribbella koreensis]|uniref:NACHT domain-containing protein n=1 Tax=Kribbella koreensis TaxID=57909 RepID=A0ABN1RAL4_9ACTN